MIIDDLIIILQPTMILRVIENPRIPNYFFVENIVKQSKRTFLSKRGCKVWEHQGKRRHKTRRY